MKLKSLYLIVTICLLSACKQSSDKKPFWYDFDGMATLEINYSNNSKEQICTVRAYKMFPEAETNISDTIPAGSGKRTYNLPVSWPQRLTFTAAGSDLTLMLLPGSKLICNIDFSDLRKTTFTAQDSLSNVNEYLLGKDYAVSGQFKIRRNSAVKSAQNLTGFSNTMDKIYKDEEQFFNGRKANLPQWFRNYEFWENRYSDAFTRMNSIIVREYSSNVPERIPSGYFSFLDTLPTDNDAAKNFHSYYYFLFELFNKRWKDKDSIICNKKEYLDYHICQADQELSGDNKDLYKAHIIQNIYNLYKKDLAKDYIKSHDRLFSDPVWKDQLENYFQDKEKFIAKNKLAPNFVLADLKDSLTSLRSLKGNVVVLSFWFAGCKPCIEEFPAENALSEKFKNKPVKIVSVCVNTTEKQWRSSSKKYDLKTINLWANASWEKTIVEKYGLYGFPRYILIDPDQKISEDNANRPSKGLESQINDLLNK